MSTGIQSFLDGRLLLIAISGSATPDACAIAIYGRLWSSDGRLWSSLMAIAIFYHLQSTFMVGYVI